MSDPSGEIAQSYNFCNETSAAAQNGMCLISPEGVLRYVNRNDLTAKRNVTEMVLTLKSFHPPAPSSASDGESGQHPSTDLPPPLHSAADDDTISVTSATLPPVATAGPAAATVAAPVDNADILTQMLASITTSVASVASAYNAELQAAPLRTKAITSCVISVLGELIGHRLKPRRPDGSKEPLSAQRVAVFAVYGLAVTGPFFHWWYGFLERSVSRMKLSSILPASASVQQPAHTVVKLAMTQLLMTPPFLLFTLAYIRYFTSFSRSATVRAVKNSFAAALFTNWRVWTVAQAVNFQLVPLQYRVLFGNLVALWW
eukprot:CAMPEP_0174955268 /NCGR_PEP_ID=MMETSP0004_2-20121128/889_1 /TAXON_ID=420556 /ORGANISM="Ochromonas sp., Strain CCMP1393" /LENGTH=315 /DNA_ID=CAMNT_0016203181 /DNA_START=288 /DNA_END=1232 /DNA_ORIENTATION=+